MVECYPDFPLLTRTGWGRRLTDKSTAQSYARDGFARSSLTLLESERCLVHQDMGVRLERLREGIEWVERRLGVYPFWNCAIRLFGETRERHGTSHLGPRDLW